MGNIVVVEVFDHLCKHGAVCAAYVKPLSFYRVLPPSRRNGHIGLRLHVDGSDVVAHRLERAGDDKGLGAEVHHGDASSAPPLGQSEDL